MDIKKNAVLRRYDALLPVVVPREVTVLRDVLPPRLAALQPRRRHLMTD